MLLFRLIEWIEAKTKFGSLTLLATCTILAVLGWLNICGIRDLLVFAIACYPV